MRILNLARTRTAEVAPEALAQAQTPVLRGYLLAAGLYYVIVSLSHPFFEEGVALAVLAGLSLLAAGCALGLWWRFGAPVRLVYLELGALAMNGLFMANVVAYQLLHFEALKLIYFVLMALVFATSAPTRRVAYVSTAAAIIGLVLMAGEAPEPVISHYGYVGLASMFAAIGMSTLMRGAVQREIRARLASEELNEALRRELDRNRALTREAQELAIAAHAADRAKGEFLATMSHEIRTPLNGVLGMIQIMQRDRLSEPQRERLGVARQAATDLLDILNAVLDISKIESGQMTVSPAPFETRRFAETLRRLYGQIAAEKGLRFELAVDAAEGERRFGDEVRLRQVISNLIANALKFTTSGGVSVHIDGDHETLTFFVADTGPGIPTDRQTHVFERFVQADGSNTRRAGGTGLGLAICRELVLLMGGAIRFESEPGRGTRFDVTLPMPRLSQAAAGGGAGRTAAAAALAPGSRVLIVDDGPANRVVLQALLEDAGFDCTCAADGQEAVEMSAIAPFDVILMDVHMPGLDGLEATRRIRAREAGQAARGAPVVAVTASVLAHEKERYLACGFDAVVPKPVELEVLLEVMAEACARRRSRLRASA
ncbi:ATP-binding protein [Phenylobacterium sp.]|uniref:ATP-binding protein n=1 Tax=Phenylobacterium sp. TaxID=1871053 RepID=UPI0025E62CAC|nr:ATP-binding protein [Phenylobacterium sp.]